MLSIATHCKDVDEDQNNEEDSNEENELNNDDEVETNEEEEEQQQQHCEQWSNMQINHRHWNHSQTHVEISST